MPSSTNWGDLKAPLNTPPRKFLPFGVSWEGDTPSHYVSPRNAILRGLLFLMKGFYFTQENIKGGDPSLRSGWLGRVSPRAVFARGLLRSIKGVGNHPLKALPKNINGGDVSLRSTWQQMEEGKVPSFNSTQKNFCRFWGKGGDPSLRSGRPKYGRLGRGLFTPSQY